MKIFESNYSKEEIRKRTGDLSQLGGISFFEFTDGMSRGVRAARFKSINGGISMTVVPDRALDISDFSYKGIPLVWRSSTTVTNPYSYESEQDEWLRSFFGGLLTTCGLTHFGDPDIDGLEKLGLHGRISNIAAQNVSSDSYWEDEEYIMEISGKINQVKALGEKLALSRKIRLFSAKSAISIEDSIENSGYSPMPFMILYHMNFGWPLLDENAELHVSKGEITPLNEDSNKNLKQFNQFIEPTCNFNPEAFAHDIKEDNEGFCHAMLVNRKLDKRNGIAVVLKFAKENLPYLIEWKNFNPGEYVLGLEPGNAYIYGRTREREAGRLRIINPGERVKTRVEVRILNGQSEIDNYIKQHIK